MAFLKTDSNGWKQKSIIALTLLGELHNDDQIDDVSLMCMNYVWSAVQVYTVTRQALLSSCNRDTECMACNR